MKYKDFVDILSASDADINPIFEFLSCFPKVLDVWMRLYTNTNDVSQEICDQLFALRLKGFSRSDKSTGMSFYTSIFNQRTLNKLYS